MNETNDAKKSATEPVSIWSRYKAWIIGSIVALAILGGALAVSQPAQNPAQPDAPVITETDAGTQTAAVNESEEAVVPVTWEVAVHRCGGKNEC